MSQGELTGMPRAAVRAETSLQTAAELRDLFDYKGINNETKAHVWEGNRGKCHRGPD